MNMKRAFAAGAVCILGFGGSALQAQQPQIPTLQVCNKTVASGSALVKIAKRQDGLHTGSFKISLDLSCDPAGTGYPTGSVQITGLSMSDSIVQGAITSTSLEQVTTTGKHTPTLYLNGRCKAASAPGCRFWLLVADNKPAGGSGTPDIVSFLVFDATGKRVAYGTGPVADGDLQVTATSN